MQTTNGKLRIIICFLTCLLSSSFSKNQAAGSSSEWKAVFLSGLPLYGHRNWIVVADSAFPVYASPAIETIVVNEDLPTVLKYVARSISTSRPVRPTVFLDQELQFIDEQDYPGAAELRRQIMATFVQDHVSSIPDSEVMTKIDEAGKAFRILFLKTQQLSLTPQFTYVSIVAI